MLEPLQSGPKSTFTRSLHCLRCNLLLHPLHPGSVVLTDDFGRSKCERSEDLHMPNEPWRPYRFAALDPALTPKPKPMPKLEGYGYVEVAGVRYANSWVEPGRTIRLEL